MSDGSGTPPPLEGAHLADSTVWSKVRARQRPDLAEWFNKEVREGRILTCQPVALEILRSARDSAAFSEQSAQLDLLHSCPIGPREFSRARTVQALLAARGQHKGVPPQDLLIAAAAESAGVPIVHYDHDFDLVAAVTGQHTLWLRPAGSIR